VLRCAGGFARGVANADGAVGVRCSPHPDAAGLARTLAARGVGPVTATSLNRSGDPPATTREEARAVCGGGEGAPRRLEARQDAGRGAASTVVDVSGPSLRVLRWGAIDEEQLHQALAEIAA
jgi:tRNA A37 threonylcarbamoyladenosine synthetase subunit TsaC/SUA5/YrdC